jgi:hypothetical protein
MLRPFAEATLIFTEPASTPMSPVSTSPLAKMTLPRAMELSISHRISDTTASSARISARVFCSKTSRLMLSIVSQARW